MGQGGEATAETPATDQASTEEAGETSAPPPDAGTGEAPGLPILETLTPAAMGRFEGRVYWQALELPVAGAAVSLAPLGGDGEPRQGATEADGRFVIEDVPPGTYQMLVSASAALAEPAACESIGVDFSRRPDQIDDASSVATLVNGSFSLQAESPGGYVLEPGGSVEVDVVLTCS